MDNARTRAGVRVAFEPCSSHLGRGACEDIGNVLVGDHRDRRDDRKSYGQALVEFAIVLPIAVLILAAIIQLAFIYERQIGIENAVRDAARAAAALPTDDSNAGGHATWAAQCLVDAPGDPSDTCGRNLFPNNVQDYTIGDLAGYSVCYANGPTDPSGNQQVLVTVIARYLHPLFVPIISGILDGIDGTVDGKFEVDTSSTFRVENAEDAPGLGAQACASGS